VISGKRYSAVHDTILFYAGGDDYTFSHQYKPYDESYIEKFYKHVDTKSGRRFSLGDITAPGGAAEAKGNPFYKFLGVERYWRFSEPEAQRLYEAGEIVQAKPGAVPRQKRYLDTGKGVPVGTLWDDIGPIQSSAAAQLKVPEKRGMGAMIGAGPVGPAAAAERSRMERVRSSSASVSKRYPSTQSVYFPRP